MKKKLIFIVSFLLFIFTVQADDKGYNIMLKVFEQSRIHKTQVSDVFMQIIDNETKKRQRYFSLKKKVSSKNTKSLVKIYKPSSIKGISLLSHSFEKIKAKQWLYLPAFKSIKNLSIEEQNSSFLGSDFTRLDIIGRQLNQDKHLYKKEDSKFYYISSIPKDAQDAYSKINYVINKKTLLPIYVEFFNRKGVKFKTLKNNKYKKIKGMYVVSEAIMKNLNTKGQTVVSLQDIEVGLDINDNEVDIKGLKQ